MENQPTFYAKGDPTGKTYRKQLEQGSIVTVLEEKFEIASLLGVGAAGVTYEAREEGGSGRRVALKFLQPLPHFLNLNGQLVDEKFIRRFKYEARISEIGPHPNVVSVLRFSPGKLSADSMPRWVIPPLIIMELAGEGTLRKKMSQTFDENECLIWTNTLLKALAHLHRHGVVHRDVKPDNILFHGGVLKLGDHGVARWPSGILADDSSPGTMTGAFVGTHRYAPPQLGVSEPGERFQRDSYRLDMFSAGATIAEIWGFKWNHNLGEHIGSVSFENWVKNTPLLIQRIIRKTVTKSWDRYYSAVCAVEDVCHFSSSLSAKGQ